MPGPHSCGILSFVDTADDAAKSQRFDCLCARFGSQNCARIMQGEIWLGATSEMMRESVGKPDEVSRRFNGERRWEYWKYWLHDLSGECWLRITFVKGVVVDWDDRRKADLSTPP